MRHQYNSEATIMGSNYNNESSNNNNNKSSLRSITNLISRQLKKDSLNKDSRIQSNEGYANYNTTEQHDEVRKCQNDVSEPKPRSSTSFSNTHASLTPCSTSAVKNSSDSNSRSARALPSLSDMSCEDRQKNKEQSVFAISGQRPSPQLTKDNKISTNSGASRKLQFKNIRSTRLSYRQSNTSDDTEAPCTVDDSRTPPNECQPCGYKSEKSFGVQSSTQRLISDNSRCKQGIRNYQTASEPLQLPRINTLDSDCTPMSHSGKENTEVSSQYNTRERSFMSMRAGSNDRCTLLGDKKKLDKVPPVCVCNAAHYYERERVTLEKRKAQLKEVCKNNIWLKKKHVGKKKLLRLSSFYFNDIYVYRTQKMYVKKLFYTDSRSVS